MLSALYAGIRPHPPVVTPLFGIAPFLGAAMSVALEAIIVQPLCSRAGRIFERSRRAHGPGFLRATEILRRTIRPDLPGGSSWPIHCVGHLCVCCESGAPTTGNRCGAGLMALLLLPMSMLSHLSIGAIFNFSTPESVPRCGVWTRPTYAQLSPRCKR